MIHKTSIYLGIRIDLVGLFPLFAHTYENERKRQFTPPTPYMRKVKLPTQLVFLIENFVLS
jgi:hypothetical protein